jgi:hypothetical protein
MPCCFASIIAETVAFASDTGLHTDPSSFRASERSASPRAVKSKQEQIKSQLNFSNVMLTALHGKGWAWSHPVSSEAPPEITARRHDYKRHRSIPTDSCYQQMGRESARRCG